MRHVYMSRPRHNARRPHGVRLRDHPCAVKAAVRFAVTSSIGPASSASSSRFGAKGQQLQERRAQKVIGIFCDKVTQNWQRFIVFIWLTQQERSHNCNAPDNNRAPSFKNLQKTCSIFSQSALLLFAAKDKSFSSFLSNFSRQWVSNRKSGLICMPPSATSVVLPFKKHFEFSGSLANSSRVDYPVAALMRNSSGRNVPWRSASRLTASGCLMVETARRSLHPLLIRSETFRRNPRPHGDPPNCRGLYAWQKKGMPGILMNGRHIVSPAANGVRRCLFFDMLQVAAHDARFREADTHTA